MVVINNDDGVFMLQIKLCLGAVLVGLAQVAAAQAVPDAGSVARDAVAKPAAAPTGSVVSGAGVEVSHDTTPIMVKSVRFVGVTLLPKSVLDKVAAEVTGQSVTLGDLQILTLQLTAKYQEAGYPLSRAFLPAQKMTDGVVTIEVVEGKLSGVKLSNQSRVSDAVVNAYLNPLVQSNANSERALLLLKDLSGTDYVGYRLAAGANKGESVLGVNLGAAPLVDGSLSEDNYGSPSTGRYRTRATVSFNSPFGRGEQVSIQGMSSFQGVDYGHLGIQLPIGHDGLSLRAGLSHTEYELGASYKNLDATGRSNSADVGLRYPLIRSDKRNVYLFGGAEYRDLRDTIGVTSTQTDKSMTLGNIGVSASLQDALFGGGVNNVSLTYTNGRLSIDSPSALAIDALSAQTNGTFNKLSLSLSRQQYITSKLSFNASLSGQWADRNLDSSEKLSLGGADSVAAYTSNDASGDKGWVGRAELRYAVHPNVTLSAFYDVGNVWVNAKPYMSGSNQVRLHGGGLGLYANYKKFDLQALVSWRGSSVVSTDDKNPRVWVNLGYKF